MNTVQFSLRNQALFDNINACCNDVYMNPLVFQNEQPETGTLRNCCCRKHVCERKKAYLKLKFKPTRTSYFRLILSNPDPGYNRSSLAIACRKRQVNRVFL